MFSHPPNLTSLDLNGNKKAAASSQPDDQGLVVIKAGLAQNLKGGVSCLIFSKALLKKLLCCSFGEHT